MFQEHWRREAWRGVGVESMGFICGLDDRKSSLHVPMSLYRFNRKAMPDVQRIELLFGQY